MLPTGTASTAVTPALVEQSSAPISAETLDWIIDAVEQRVLDELERRGLRFRPGVI